MKSLFVPARLCVLFLCLSCLLQPYKVSAETAKEKYQRIQRELKAQKEKLERAKKKEHSVLEDLDTINKRLDSIEAELRKQQMRISQTESSIKKVEAEIAVNREDMDRQKTWMRRKLRLMQRYGQGGEMLFLLMSSEDMADLTRRWKYLERIAIYERNTIQRYADNLRRLNAKERQLQGLRASLKRDEEGIRITETALAEKKRDKGVLLASVRGERETHEKMLRELQDASRRLLDTLRKLEEKDTYEAKGFSALKGKLRWPVNGRVAIPYGSHNDPRFNTPVFRNGVYIETKDDSVKAVSGGKVVFSDWFKGYGNLLIINHGEGYHTLYANLAETFFKVGDIIKISETVGRVGESGVFNAPSLYFELRYKGKPLDPVQWLKRKSGG